MLESVSVATAMIGDDEDHYKDRYVKIGASHPSWSVWSNDPKKMQLEAYFSADAEVPSIGSQFNMNLKPVLVKEDAGAGDTFLLTDDKGGFFLWNENGLEMHRFIAPENTTLDVNDVAAMVRGETFSNEELARQFWNPTGKTGVAESI